MSNQKSINYRVQISSFEKSLMRFENENFSTELLDEARNELGILLSTLCSISPIIEGTKLDSSLKDIERSAERRDAAILLLRSLEIDGLLSVDVHESKASRIIPSLVEQVLPNIAKYCKTSEKKLSYEKIESLRTFHGFVLSNFSNLTSLSSDLNEINNLKTNILRPFSNGLYQSYLQPFGFLLFSTKVESITSQIEQLISCNDARYKNLFDQLSEEVRELDSLCDEYYSFFSQKIIKFFVISLQTAISQLGSTASDRFHCELTLLRKSIKAAEKRYPLHEVDRYVTFKIPMTNNGPGIAVGVVVEIDVGNNQSLMIMSEEQRLGDIPPGDFALLIPVCVIQSIKNVRMTIQLEWRQLFGKDANYVFDVEIEGQDPSVNWSQLEQIEPYSLEVAQGDHFVGRIAKVKSIGNRLLKSSMSSTYITGQKRIGKTSLAHAVMQYTSENTTADEFKFLYLEYGEYCSSSPEVTLKSLGENIYEFLKSSLPNSIEVSTPNFQGSLSPLNSIAKLLYELAPLKRFVIILDEFDEIHPEMYRLGALAETFFANIRTLASRNNLAFILVGGERMPFIIGAQGDQLNKFVREPLDYFSRSTEWEEYCKLVKNPVQGLLNWDDAAISELFNLTNGHPYYTNLLCSRIVSIAVRERDTEIISSDVRHAMNILISELDTNSFAHMWKDGINSEREIAEVTELKRLRMLVGIGRALRNNDRSISNVLKTISSTKLAGYEGQPLLDDFIRRDIIQDIKGELFFTIPLFEKWLVEIGVASLISSTLADDLEVELKRADDAAYVSASEVQGLSESWPLYRAQPIGSEAIRAWLEQVPSFQDQRLLFKILKKIRFISTLEIEEKLIQAHSKLVRGFVGALQIEKRTDKRKDIWITYLAGPGKSDVQYARIYAKANSISTECILDLDTVERRLRSHDSENPKAILVIDDVVGSGTTFSNGIVKFENQLGALLNNHSIPFLGISLLSTELGEKKINATINSLKFLDMHFYSCENVSPLSYAFSSNDLGFWSSLEERDRAKALCIRLGTGLYKDPLGYSGQGLLLVMPDTCPNNSLPILHKSKSINPNWKALFPRPTT